MLVSGDTGILVGQVGGLDSVTRFVSVSELSKLGINLTASDIARSDSTYFMRSILVEFND